MFFFFFFFFFFFADALDIGNALHSDRRTTKLMVTMSMKANFWEVHCHSVLTQLHKTCSHDVSDAFLSLFSI